jgi:hypothetical protein
MFWVVHRQLENLLKIEPIQVTECFLDDFDKLFKCFENVLNAKNNTLVIL